MIELLFEYYVVDMLFKCDVDGVVLMVIVGDVFGLYLFVMMFLCMLYVVVEFVVGGWFEFDVLYEECVVYVVDGEFVIDGMLVLVEQMVVFVLGVMVMLMSVSGVCVMLFGGDWIDGECYIEWNFVVSSCEVIEWVKVVWMCQEMGKVFGEIEWILLFEVKLC